MPGSTNASFIPKRNTEKNSRQSAKRQVFVGTFVIKILFFAVLVATVGVFIYNKKLTNDLNVEITNLNNAIALFDEEKLARVVEVDTRINQTKQRLSYSSSMVALLDAVEKSTINSSQITELNIKREDDTSYTLESNIKTDSFDSVLFQRSLLKSNDILAISEITNLALNNVPPNNGLYDKVVSTGEAVAPSVTFKAVLTVATDKIRHQAPVTAPTVNTDVPLDTPIPTDTEIEASSAGTSSVNSLNQEVL